MSHQTLVILDFGSQYTQLIARRVREMGVYCRIQPCTDRAPAALEAEVIGVVLSGGPASVLGDDAPPFDTGWISHDRPILGVCYGMQLLAHLGGGELGRGRAREYGRSDVDFDASCPLFAALPSRDVMWMSHGDHVEAVPPGWRVAATSDGVIAAMMDEHNPRFGLQFHPEVAHSPRGADVLRAFVLGVCGARGDWTPNGFVDEAVQRVRETVAEGRVICGLSGGVDSSVVAALLHRALGDRLHCVFVDNGLLREGEVEAIEAEFSDLPLTVAREGDRFLAALAGLSEPEAKRKAIGRVFVEVFEAHAREVEDAKWLAQGTLYPDVIESVSVRGPSATIKSHHNVGGLPERMRLGLVEPLRELFKDEVRAVGRELGLSKGRVDRHPFPGPGLAIRCIGEITPERLTTLRRADAIVREEIDAAGLHDAVWQAFAILLPVRAVGVMGDERTWEETCVIRVVESSDGMTADFARLPWDLLARMSGRIINEVRGINRVTYDVSTKPPGTIEWE